MSASILGIVDGLSTLHATAKMSCTLAERFLTIHKARASITWRRMTPAPLKFWHAVLVPHEIPAIATPEAICRFIASHFELARFTLQDALLLQKCLVLKHALIRNGVAALKVGSFWPFSYL
jgi:hypothetical protein